MKQFRNITDIIYREIKEYFTRMNLDHQSGASSTNLFSSRLNMYSFSTKIHPYKRPNCTLLMPITEATLKVSTQIKYFKKMVWLIFWRERVNRLIPLIGAKAVLDIKLRSKMPFGLMVFMHLSLAK